MARLISYLPLFAALVLVLLLSIILLAPRPPAGTSAISLEASVSSAACNGTVELSAELRDGEGRRVPDSLIGIYAGKTRLDSLYTDRNGRVGAEFPINRSWCGRVVDFLAAFEGSGALRGSSAVFPATIKFPSSLALEVPEDAEEGQMIEIRARLTNPAQGAPIAGKSIAIGNLSAMTDLNGTARANVSFPGEGEQEIRAVFQGDAFFEPSAAEETIRVSPRMCEDGTLVGECSGEYYCAEDRELEARCSACGCPGVLLCVEERCISEEERLQGLIETLQKGNLKIESDEGIGSGVIIGKNGSDLLILTNRHVVDADFAFISNTNLEVLNFDNETAKPARIYIAPNQLDLAIIVVQKDMGPPADIDYGLKPKIGAEVLAIGTPLGIPNSVTSGIISNYVETNTSSGFVYEVIQTDAAVNPGNSGGGVYLAGSGRLIGIISFKLVIRGRESDQLAEGLGFAIPVGIVDDYPLSEWKIIAPG